MPDRMPEDMPDRMPEDLPDRMPEDMPEHMPEDMPDRMPEDMPEDLPVRTCINVMVGITRSKVISDIESKPTMDTGFGPLHVGNRPTRSHSLDKVQHMAHWVSNHLRE